MRLMSKIKRIKGQHVTVLSIALTMRAEGKALEALKLIDIFCAMCVN